MLSSTQCDDYEPLLAAYALGEGDPETSAALEAHLATCPRCQASLNAYRAVAQVLPLGVPAAEPSPDLRSRLLERMASESQGRTADRHSRFRATRWRAPLRWRQVALLLNAGVLVMLLVWNVTLQQQQQERAARQRQSWAVVSQILSTPGVEQFMLTGEAATPAASGALMFAPGEQLGCLVVTGMPQLAPDQVYQLWLIRGDQRTSGGTFRVDQTGNGWLLVEQPVTLDRFEAVGITTEPAGGSPGPSSPRIIGGTL